MHADKHKDIIMFVRASMSNMDLFVGPNDGDKGCP